jgi:methionine sulfoxide reductase heme-binding subunit
MRPLYRHWLWIVANLGALYPLLHLLWDTQVGNLSINPIADLTARTGQAAIVLLLLTLAVTPVQILTGYNPIAKIRKSLGLWAFAYTAIHLWIFVGLDYGYSWRFIVIDGLPQKPYIIAGFVAFIILLPLAITSTRGWMKRLGQQWKRLHQLIYVAGVLAVLHYIWVGKVFIGKPVYYAILLAMMLALRLPPVRRGAIQARRRWFGSHRAARPGKSPRRMAEMKRELS